MTALYVIVLVAWALAAWVCVVKIIPACVTSTTRYRLWRLRDQLFDEIRHGDYHDDTEARKVLNLVEASIQGIGEVSILNVVFSRWAYRGLEPPDGLFPDLQCLGVSDKARLSERLTELSTAFALKAFVGSVSGWFVLALLLPPLLLVELIRRILRGASGRGSLLAETRSNLRDELDFEDALAVVATGPRNRRSPMWHHV